MPNDKREAMGKSGREYIKENFSRNIVINTYIKNK